MRLAVVVACALAAVAGAPGAARGAEAPSMDFGSWVEPSSSVMEMESFLELGAEQLPDAATVGYVPLTSAFDNPGVVVTPTPSIPTNPDCTVRPQTIVEIKRMRRSAARIAQMIQTEVVIMEKRKTYVEHMTSYLNDRIRELNKVKGELEQEYRWIEVSNQRINELAQKEKLIKMQDILSCLNSDAANLQGKKNAQAAEIAAMQSQATVLQNSINQIKNNINSVNAGKPNAGVAIDVTQPAGQATLPGDGATDALA